MISIIKATCLFYHLGLPGPTKHCFREHHDDRAHMITLQMFIRSYYILGSDITPNMQSDEEHISLPVREICALWHNSKTITRTRHMHLYAEFPGHVEIDICRNVTLE